MPDARDLYELLDETPDLGRPVLIQALTGFVDAGNATRLAREQLLEHPETRVIARFDIDTLLDYRSRRPSMTFDNQDTPVLVLGGLEPDLLWERFTESVIDLVRRLNVKVTIGFNSIPMAVPHTRPTGITAHASNKELIAGYEPWLQRVQVPASAGHLLEYRLGQAGLDAMGFAVHIPHYLAQTDFPAAAELLLTSTSRTTGLLFSTDDLRASAEVVRDEVDRQIAENPDAVELVESLEAQYDAFTRGRTGGGNLLANSGPLPTAEELGAELERFLAGQVNPPNDPPQPG
jgi:hypothetical protein